MSIVKGRLHSSKQDVDSVMKKIVYNVFTYYDNL